MVSTTLHTRQHGEGREYKETIKIKPIHLNVILSSIVCILSVAGSVVDTSDLLQGPTPTELPAPSSEPVSLPGLGPSVMRNLQIARKYAAIFLLIIPLFRLCSI